MSIENEKSFEETLKPVNLREKLVEDERMSRAERKFYRSQNAVSRIPTSRIYKSLISLRS